MIFWLLCIVIALFALFATIGKVKDEKGIAWLIHFAGNFVWQLVIATVALIGLWWLWDVISDASAVFGVTNSTPEFIRSALKVIGSLWGIFVVASLYWKLAGFNKS